MSYWVSEGVFESDGEWTGCPWDVQSHRSSMTVCGGEMWVKC